VRTRSEANQQLIGAGIQPMDLPALATRDHVQLSAQQIQFAGQPGQSGAARADNQLIPKGSVT
jgi:hypothetical protein